MNAADFATPLAAGVAGLVTSAHCAVMCGPLSCALLGTGPVSPADLRAAALRYHGARVVSYAGFGLLLGALGETAGGIFHAPVSRLLPWMLALLLVAIAFGWEKKLPRLPVVNRWLMKANLRAVALPRRRAALLLGAVTPFLPCGPLYLAFGVALVAGSGLAGATLLASFALGTIPLYALAQFGVFRWSALWNPTAQIWTRRVLALGSVALVGGRALLHDGSLAAPLRCLLCR